MKSLRNVLDWKLGTTAVGLVLVVAIGAFAIIRSTAEGSAGDSVELAATYDWLVESAPAPQAATLIDHSVDRPEYVAAVAATRACMAERGVATSEPVWNPMGQLSFEFGGSPDRASLAPMKVVYEECSDLHMNNIAAAWATGSAPTSLP